MIFVRFKLVDFGLAQTEPNYKDLSHNAEHHSKSNC